jgi:hypothetical protein
MVLPWAFFAARCNCGFCFFEALAVESGQGCGEGGRVSFGLIDMKWQMTDQLTLLGGVQYKKYGFDTFEQRRTNGTTANQEATVPAGAAAVATSAYSNLVSAGNFGAPAGSQLSWSAPNLQAAAQLMGLYDPALYPLGT